MEMEMEGSTILEMRPNQEDMIQLYNAAMTGSVTILHTLLQNHPLILNESSLTALSETPLHVASTLGHVDFARALLAKKPSLASERDSLGRRPLHLAVAEGHVEVVRELVKADEDVCVATDGEDRTPLHLAAMRGRVQVVRELFRARPRAAEMASNGDSVLHLCVKYCQLEALQVLVELLGDRSELLSVGDFDGNTVLHLAALLSPFKVVKYLVSVAGVAEKTINSTNRNGCTPLDISEKCPKDFRSLQTQHLLMELGSKNAKDIESPLPSSTLTTPCHEDNNTKKSKIKDFLELIKTCLTERVDWIYETHGNLMVVATVIATMSFQAVISPPGGVFPYDPKDENKAGKAVFTERPDYQEFSDSTKVSFVASLGVILLHFGGFPLKNRIGTWLVTTVMCVAIAYVFAAFKHASRLVNCNDLHHTFIFWKVLLGCVVGVHTFRFAHWLLQKTVQYFEWNILISRWSLPLSLALAAGTYTLIYFLGEIL